MEHRVSRGLGIHYEPSLKMKFIPGFYCCGIPNPNALAFCPKCGAAAATGHEVDAEQVVMTYPRVARILFAIGEWLKKWANRIEGDR